MPPLSSSCTCLSSGAAEELPGLDSVDRGRVSLRHFPTRAQEGRGPLNVRELHDVEHFIDCTEHCFADLGTDVRVEVIIDVFFCVNVDHEVVGGVNENYFDGKVGVVE